MVHIYDGILFSHSKDEITSFEATWIGLENVIQRKVTQSEKKYFMTSLNVESKKEMLQTNLLTKYRETHRCRE